MTETLDPYGNTCSSVQEEGIEKLRVERPMQRSNDRPSLTPTAYESHDSPAPPCSSHIGDARHTATSLGSSSEAASGTVRRSAQRSRDPRSSNDPPGLHTARTDLSRNHHGSSATCTTRSCRRGYVSAPSRRAVYVSPCATSVDRCRLGCSIFPITLCRCAGAHTVHAIAWLTHVASLAWKHRPRARHTGGVRGSAA
jgi:hypothetical protein